VGLVSLGRASSRVGPIRVSTGPVRVSINPGMFCRQERQIVRPTGENHGILPGFGNSPSRMGFRGSPVRAEAAPEGMRDALLLSTAETSEEGRGRPQAHPAIPTGGHATTSAAFVAFDQPTRHYVLIP